MRRRFEPGERIAIWAANSPEWITTEYGTTGFPKGALLHHRSLANNGAHTMDRMGIGEVAVVGLTDKKSGEEISAFIRPAAGALIDKNEL